MVKKRKLAAKSNSLNQNVAGNEYNRLPYEHLQSITSSCDAASASAINTNSLNILAALASADSALTRPEASSFVTSTNALNMLAELAPSPGASAAEDEYSGIIYQPSRTSLGSTEQNQQGLEQEATPTFATNNSYRQYVKDKINSYLNIAPSGKTNKRTITANGPNKIWAIKRGCDDFRSLKMQAAAKTLLPLIDKLNLNENDYVLKILPVVFDTFRITFENKSNDSAIRQIFNTKNSKDALSEEQLEIKQRVSNIFGIGITYILFIHMKKTAGNTSSDKQARYLNHGINEDRAQKDFNDLCNLSFEIDKTESLDVLLSKSCSHHGVNQNLLPGKKASDYIGLRHRLEVAKQRVRYDKNSHDYVPGYMYDPSPFEVLNMETFSNWFKCQTIFANQLYDNHMLPKLMGNIQRNDLPIEINKFVKKAFDKRSLVQKFRSDLVKKIMNIIFHNSPNVGNVIDVCGGWGDRLLGYMSMLNNNTKGEGVNISGNIYINDTNKDLIPSYQSMVSTYLSQNNQNRCYFSAYQAEKLSAENLGLTQRVNFSITSPPYFNRELYKGSRSSHQCYKTYEDWKSGFLGGMATSLSSITLEGGWACIMVSDLTVEGGNNTAIPLIRDTEDTFSKNNFSLIARGCYNNTGSSQAGFNSNGFRKKSNGETMLFFKKKPNIIRAPQESREENEHSPSLFGYVASGS